MARRLDLQAKLEEIMESFVSKPWRTNRVLYQPPETIKMEYPCIVYDLDGIDSTPADNLHYLDKKRWNVTVIDRNPDSEIPSAILSLQYTRFSRHYTSDNLHHWMITIYS